VLLTGSEGELCSVLHALLQAVAYHFFAVGLPAITTICLLIVYAEMNFLLLPPSLCVLVFRSLYIVQFSFLGGGGSVCPGGYAGLSLWLLGEYRVMLGVHPLGLPNVFQVGLQLPAHLFSQVMWCGESLYGLGV
jgi:hypothetical protein